jgi:hypothetical protein
MKRKHLIILAAAFLCCVLAASWVLAQGSAAIDWWVFSGGGGPASSGGGVAIDATLGQPVIGPSSAGASTLGAGYWYGQGEPTAVRLASFQATPSRGGILVTWETASELDNLGFDLYRRAPGQGAPEKLNEVLIPSKCPGGVVGQSYDWFDPAVQGGLTHLYYLEDVDVYGQRTRHGPVEATALYASYLPLVGTPE